MLKIVRLYKFVLLVLLACTMPARADDKYVLMLDWLPSGDKAFTYIALQKGFFKEEGLDIEIQNARGTGDALTKVATGAADFATGGLPSLLSASAQSALPIRAVMSIYSKQPDALFTTSGSSIKTLKDVVGHKVATATFTSSNTLWPIILKSNGIDLNSVPLTKVDPSVLAPMLASGQVDATISWITVGPTVNSVLKQAGKSVSIIPWSDYGLEGYGLSLFASDRAIASNPTAVMRFVKAIKRAIELGLQHPEMAGQAVHTAAPSVDSDVATESFQASIPLIKNNISDASGIGTFDKDLLAKTWNLVALSEQIDANKIDPEKSVDRRFLPK